MNTTIGTIDPAAYVAALHALASMIVLRPPGPDVALASIIAFAALSFGTITKRLGTDRAPFTIWSGWAFGFAAFLCARLGFGEALYAFGLVLGLAVYEKTRRFV